MNNERYNHIIDEAYENYQWKQLKLFPAPPDSNLSKEEFINKCKTDLDFSQRWRLKIEESELSYDERFRIAYQNLDLRKKLETESKMLHFPHGHNKVMDDVNIPTKLLTVTYNNETIEVYE